MKKAALVFVLTASLMLSACSGGNSTQNIDTLPDNSQNRPVYNDDAEYRQDSSDEENFSNSNIAEPDITFGKGVWESTDRLFTFYDDNSGNVLEKNTMTGIGFEYEPDASGLVFHLGAADNNTFAAAEAANENTVVLTWEDGMTETLRYLSGRVFCGLRAGVWKSDRNTYTFYNEIDGNVTDNETNLGVGFSFERNESGLTFHLGSGENNTAAVEVVDENTVTLAWEDGSAETLAYEPVSGFSGFTAGKWISDGAAYVFDDSNNATEEISDISASFSLHYTVYDDIIIFETFEPNALVAAAIVSASDDTVILRWSNGNTEFFSYVGAAD